MIATAGAGAWLLSSSQLELAPGSIEIGGLGYTDRSAVLAAVGLDDSSQPNVLRLDTAAMRRALLALPAVADASVQVELINRLKIEIVERTPVLGLRRPEASFVIDADGVVVAAVDEAQLAQLVLPVIDDGRQAQATPIEVGQPLDATDLAAMLDLAALSPATIGSQATQLELQVGDDNGYVITARPQGWRAIFGSYTPTLRPPDLIPRQVECLRSLLAETADEASIDTIYLAPLDERCGTFLPRATPGSSPPTPEPSA